jgi:integrase
VRRIVAKTAGTVWQARWRERGSDGRDRSCARNFRSARAARDFASRMAQIVERRGIGDPQKLSTANFLDHFIDELASSGEYSPVTIAVYRRCLGLAARELGSTPLARLTTAHIDSALAALLRQGGRSRQDPNKRRPLTRKTVHLVHRILSIALARAAKRHLIASNPARDATAPSLSRTPAQGFSADEVKALLTAAETMDAETFILAALLLATGLRRSEVLGLAFGDIDFEAATLTVRRTVVEIASQPVERDGGKSEAALRTISIPPALVTLLRAQRVRVQEQALAWGPSYSKSPLYCFPGLGGKALAPKFLTQRMRALMQAAGISGRAPVHRWRHTSGSVLYDLTGNIKVVQRRLGHASHNTTMGLYVRPPTERDREASEHFERILAATKGAKERS